MIFVAVTKYGRYVIVADNYEAASAYAAVMEKQRRITVLRIVEGTLQDFGRYNSL